MYMKHISILITHQSLIAAIGNVKHMFSMVNEFLMESGANPMFKVELIGLSQQMSLGNRSFIIQADAIIQELNRTDLIIIPPVSGDILSSIEQNKPYIPWIRQQYKKGAEVASLCVGAFLLAETGLLDDKYCSTHWKTVNDFKVRYPKVRLVDHKILTDEKGIYTSGGANSYWNLLVHLVGKLTDHEIAARTSKYFEVDLDRDNQGAYSMFEGCRFHSDEPIQKVQNYLERHYNELLSLDALAGMAGYSVRTFQRRFKKATHCTVVAYLQKLRVEAAKQMLVQAVLTVNEIMYEVGYYDSDAFRKVFKKETGLTPSGYRKKFVRN